MRPFISRKAILHNVYAVLHDPTIREKFNTYRFADYKEDVITLLKKVCTVSVETVRITRLMAAVERS